MRKRGSVTLDAVLFTTLCFSQQYKAHKWDLCQKSEPRGAQIRPEMSRDKPRKRDPHWGTVVRVKTTYIG